ncbi:hypothetical protein SALBM217S_02343 [Streptomyces griseoloalbus]|uniref:Uncharacterized protein n=1 Tax=Streptomyces pseudogriseolus TaxID=36817 RepID=A0ABQ2TQP1_STREZ|nr:hypothetical protein GCM10010285_65480 [Streptomyces rubiginosus]
MTGQQKAPAAAGALREDPRRGDAKNHPLTSVGTGDGDVPPADYRQATAVWARTQIHAFAGSGPIPEYGTADWLRLPDRDPRRYAAVIVAAEQAREPRPPADRARARQTPPPRPRPLQATDDWPPVAVPGCPGVYLTAGEGA